MPRLRTPFMIVGAAAGWLSATFFDNPLADATPNHAAGRAALCSGIIAGGLGLILQKRCVPRVAWMPEGGMWLQVIALVALGGALSGAITGWLAFENERGLTSGAVAGLLAAALFLPVCVLVIAASRRAARARLGSLIAAADRREMWALMAAALAVCTATAFPDWMAGETPLVALSMALGALATVAALALFDLRARAVVRRAAREASNMVLRERGGEEAEGAVPAFDLGLGDEVRAAMVRSRTAYRGGDRAASLLVGSLDEARRAVRHALLKKLGAAAVVGLALGGHALATRWRGSVIFHEIACERGSAVDCGIAAAMLREGDAEDMVRAVVLGTHACESGSPPDQRGCVVAAEMIERDPARNDRASVLHYRERACFTGHLESCRAAVRLLGDDQRWRAAAIHARACEAGHMKSCEDAVAARAAAREQDLQRTRQAL